MYTEFVKDNIYRNYVGGDWVIADDSKLIEIYSPSVQGQNSNIKVSTRPYSLQGF